MATNAELKDAICEAVATLDEADGSRISTAEALDAARDILKDAYGPSFEKDVSEFLDEDDNDQDVEDEDADAENDD